MEIRNKTKRPLRVPLPGGKKLHLGPGKTGQITPKAAEFPALKKLIDDEQLEIVAGSSKTLGSGTERDFGSTDHRPSGGAPRHTGDR